MSAELKRLPNVSENKRTAVEILRKAGCVKDDILVLRLQRAGSATVPARSGRKNRADPEPPCVRVIADRLVNRQRTAQHCQLNNIPKHIGNLAVPTFFTGLLMAPLVQQGIVTRDDVKCAQALLFTW